MRRPVLATSTDGVGTKVVLASRLGRYDTIGIDLVGMVVDDLVVCGAEPLFMTDYMVFGVLRPERAAAILSGVAEGCVQAGCALIGGETAEHPGHFGPDDFDLAGAATGVVEQDALLGPHRVIPGDVVLAMASSGLHSNGFSLVRQILDRAGLSLDAEFPELGGPLGAALLTPTRIYARDCLALTAACEVHAYAHVTGGGLAANLARVLPAGADAVLDRATWRPPAIVRPAGRAGRSTAGGDGPRAQHGCRHDRGGRPGRRRPCAGHAGQPRCPGLGAGRDRARHRNRPYVRAASTRVKSGQHPPAQPAPHTPARGNGRQ